MIKFLRRSFVFLLVVLPFSALLAQIQEPSAITGLKLWLDASDVTATGTNPATGSTVTSWKDRSGKNNHAVVPAGQNPAKLMTNEINGKAVMRFTRLSIDEGSVYQIPGVDIRASVIPTVTIFTVYKQGTRSGDQGLWGDDNEDWDRFYFTSWSTNGSAGVNNGGASLGPTNPAAIVKDAGVQGITRLLTAVYDHQVTNGSSIYFNGRVVTNFTDRTHATNAQNSFYIGFDGDNNCYNGDIAEVIVYDRKLTACEMMQVNRYLVNKYDVELTSVTITASGTTTLDQGKTVTLTASANGTDANTTYQWLRNGKPVSGATAVSFKTGTPGDYQAVVINTCRDTSSVTNVKVNASGLVPPGNALVFDGVNDYINCGNILTPSYTKEAWIFMSNTTGVNNIISGLPVNNTSSHAFWAPATAGNKLSAGHNANWFTVQDTDPLLVNKWYHVAVTYDATTRVMTLYKNGKQVAQATNVPAYIGDNYVQIGAFDNNSTFQGGIDEVRLYNNALSATEIQADMFKTVSTLPPNLIAYYNFDQAISGGSNTAYTVLADQSDAANDGVLVNFTLTGAASNWFASYAMVIPTATAVTNAGTNGFTANWTAPTVGTATSYLLDVSTNAAFSSFVTGYNALSIPGTATSCNVTGLLPARNYYYRVRAVKTGVAGEGNYSNVITAATIYQAPNHILGTIGGLKLWLDAADVNATGTNPATNTAVTTWQDKSGYGNSATTFTGQNAGTVVENQIGGKAVVRFNRVSQVKGTGYEVPGVDIRATAMPATTIFTVYKQGAQTGDQALWGNDNQDWDRFFFTSWAGNTSANNGGASLGPTNPAAIVTGAGIPGITRLLTAVYNNGVTNGSNIYFDGKVITTFTDRTDPVNAQTSFRIGFDGDDNFYNGDIAEVIVFDHKLSDCERLQVNKYLSGKYGVTFSSVDVINTSGTTTFTEGKSVTFSSGVTGSAYQWFRNGNAITGANTIAYTAALPGNYQVSVNYGSCLDTSIAIPVVVTPIAMNAPGNTLRFDGTNDYADAGTILPASYTKEAWIYMTTPGAENPILAGNTTGANSHAFGVPGTTGQYKLAAGHNGNWSQVQDNDILSINKWYHVAVSYDAATTTMRLYKDGVQVAENTNVAAYAGSNALLIGGFNINGTNKVFGGSIDEVRIYNTALSQAAIQADMFSTTAPAANLVAYYNFDQATAAGNNTGTNRLLDRSANENTAVLQNFSLAGNSSNWIESYAMVAVTAKQPTHILADGFTANWSAPAIGTADRYLLDVSVSPVFASFVTGYNALPVTGTSYAVTGLNSNTAYYYRVRADKSTIPNQGNYSNSIVTATDFSPPGNALAFDGANDYVEIADSTAFQSATASVGVWLRPEWTSGAQAAPGYHVFLSQRATTAASTRYELSISDDYKKLNFFNGTTTASIDYNFRKGTWYHLAVTFGAGNTTAYVNGQAIGTFNQLYQASTGFRVTLGWNHESATNASYWQGGVDELRFYNAVLTAAQVQADMASTLPVATASLVAHYNFSANLIDQTTNGHDGTAYNFAFTGAASNWVESYAMVLPVTTAASTIEANKFTANWNAPAMGAATSYFLDVSTSPAFASFVTGYNALPVTGLSQVVSNLQPFTTYYYRVRPEKASVTGQGAYSNSSSLTTIAPPVVLTRTAVVVCRGNQTAALNASFAGGSLTFTVKWYKNDALFTNNIANASSNDTTKSNATALGAGTYKVEVLNQSNVIVATSQLELVDPATLTLASTLTNASCFNKCDGRVVLAAAGGVTPYLYTFATNAPTGGTTYNNVCAGTYNASVTDNNGCTVALAPVVITQPAAVGISLYRDTLLCKGATLNVTASMGVPATYAWTSDNGFTSANAAISVTTPGTYRVTVNQTGNCTYRDSIKMRNTAQEAVPARMVLASHAFVGETVVAVNLTDQPQSQAWIIPAGAQVVSESTEKLVMKFPVMGQYEVKLGARSYDVCATRDSATVLIQPATTDIGNIREITVREVVAAPNPTTGQFNLTIKLNQAGKVAVRIYSVTGLLAYSTLIPDNGSTSIVHPVNLAGQNKGTYIIVVETDYSNEVRKLLLN